MTDPGLETAPPAATEGAPPVEDARADKRDGNGAATPPETPLPSSRLEPAKARDGFGEWLFRTEALARARAEAASVPAAEAADLLAGKQAAELGDRILEPAEPLGQHVAPWLAVFLYREAARRLLAPGTSEGETFESVWQKTERERLRAFAGSDDRLAAIESVFAADLVHSEASPEAKREKAEQARSFVHALLQWHSRADEQIARLHVQRAVRVLAVVLAAAVLAYGGATLVGRLTRQPDILAGRPWRASSTMSDPHANIFFHTTEETNPWVEFDLGAPTTFSTIEVVNRSDCCDERAIPLVVETSSDRIQWTEIARRTDPFQTWKVHLAPQTTRWVRLRVLKRTMFHLERVSLYAR